MASTFTIISRIAAFPYAKCTHTPNLFDSWALSFYSFFQTYLSSTLHLWSKFVMIAWANSILYIFRNHFDVQTSVEKTIATETNRFSMQTYWMDFIYIVCCRFHEIKLCWNSCHLQQNKHELQWCNDPYYLRQPSKTDAFENGKISTIALRCNHDDVDLRRNAPSIRCVRLPMIRTI